ncbi:hypothetical protein LXL04_027375 [Taraxacum kok-saghyz]
MDACSDMCVSFPTDCVFWYSSNTPHKLYISMHQYVAKIALSPTPIWSNTLRIKTCTFIRSPVIYADRVDKSHLQDCNSNRIPSNSRKISNLLTMKIIFPLLQDLNSTKTPTSHPPYQQPFPFTILKWRTKLTIVPYLGLPSSI